MKIPQETLAGLTLTDLYQLTKALEAIANSHGTSQAVADFVFDLLVQCDEAFYARPSQTPTEALLKLTRLGAEDIGNGSVYGPDALSDANRVLGEVA